MKKNLPPKKFLKGQRSRGLRVPEEVFTLTINGRFVQDTTAVSDSAIDIYMEPDVNTVRMVPWYTEPTAQHSATMFSSMSLLSGCPVDHKVGDICRAGSHATKLLSRAMSRYDVQNLIPTLADNTK